MFSSHNPCILVYRLFLAAALAECFFVAATFVLMDSVVFLMGLAGSAAHIAVNSWKLSGPSWMGGMLLVGLVILAPMILFANLFWLSGWLRWTGIVLCIAYYVYLYYWQLSWSNINDWMVYLFPQEIAGDKNKKRAVRASRLMHRLLAATVLLSGFLLIAGTYGGLAASFRLRVATRDWEGLQQQVAEARNVSRSRLYDGCVVTKQYLSEDMTSCARILNDGLAITASQNRTLARQFEIEYKGLLALATETKARLVERQKESENNPFGVVAFLSYNPLLETTLNMLNDRVVNLTVLNRIMFIVLGVSLTMSIVGFVYARAVASLQPDAKEPEASAQIFWLATACLLIFFLCAAASQSDLSNCEFDVRKQVYQPSCFVPSYVFTPERMERAVQLKMQTEYVQAFDVAHMRGLEEGRQQMFADAWPLFRSFDRSANHTMVLKWYDEVLAKTTLTLAHTTGKAAEEAFANVKPAGQVWSDSASTLDKVLDFFLFLITSAKSKQS